MKYWTPPNTVQKSTAFWLKVFRFTLIEN